MARITKQDTDRRRQAERAARECERVLKEKFGAREVYVFGSLAGQSPWHSRSWNDSKKRSARCARKLAGVYMN